MGGDSIRRRNPRIQGEIGLADAIGWFVAAGYRVCIPLADNQEYDLVVQGGADAPLERVQVKTCTRLDPRGAFQVQLDTHGGNRSGQTTKEFDASLVDLVYILTDRRERYLIPSGEIPVRHSITLNPSRRHWQV
jgi:hypothetical protein